MSQRWSEAEDQHLEGLLGDLPWPMVLKAYNSWAGKTGHPLRTKTALQRRMDAKRWQRSVVGEWITTGAIVHSLGVSYEAPHWWISKGWLPAVKYGNRWYIRRRELVAFARRRPEVFSRFPRAGLVQLLESERLAEELAAMPNHPGRAKPVICVETGERFSSIKQAARNAAYVTCQRLRQVLDTNQTANGKHWRSA